MTHGSDLVDSIVAQADILKGLTKREYFAAMILQGLFAGSTVHSANEKIIAAVNNADVLINELNKGVK